MKPAATPTNRWLVALIAMLLVSGCHERPEGSRDNHPASNGPVSIVGADEGFSPVSGILAGAGDQVVFGAVTVRNEGDTSAELTSAQLVGSVESDAASVSETRVVDLAKNPGDLVGASMWPFEDYVERSEPLDGFELQPGREVELLIIADVTTTGDWLWPETVVNYRVDGIEYLTRAPFGFHVCPTEAACKR